jgi:hypothetical protein
MEPKTLHDHALGCFSQAFGEPSNTLGPAAHWSLDCDGEHQCLHLLLNGGGNNPTVWLFDQRAPKGASGMHSITEMQHVDEAIEQVRARTRHGVENQPNALVSFPVRINAFVQSVRGWTDRMTLGGAAQSRSDSEKMRMWGLFLLEDEHFTSAFSKNRGDDFRSVDRYQGLNCACSFFNSVADVVVAGHGRAK